jgi:hypothetical protein
MKPHRLGNGQGGDHKLCDIGRVRAHTRQAFSPASGFAGPTAVVENASFRGRPGLQKFIGTAGFGAELGYNPVRYDNFYKT